MLPKATRAAFTLVEILVVVVILGILAAVVVPKFASASDDAAENTAFSELVKLRRAIEIYEAKYSTHPDLTEGDTVADWSLIVSSEFLKSRPRNPWVNRSNASRIAHGNGPVAGVDNTTPGWIYDPTTGNLWAGGFDINDEPIAR